PKSILDAQIQIPPLQIPPLQNASASLTLNLHPLHLALAPGRPLPPSNHCLVPPPSFPPTATVCSLTFPPSRCSHRYQPSLPSRSHRNLPPSRSRAATPPPALALFSATIIPVRNPFE
ncbi:hypothetical protein S245_016662, partial [Arachis hypogaea]